MSLRHSNHAVVGELTAASNTTHNICGDKGRRLFRRPSGTRWYLPTCDPVLEPPAYYHWSLRDRDRCDAAFAPSTTIKSNCGFVMSFDCGQTRPGTPVPEGPPKIARQFHWRERSSANQPCPVGTPEPVSYWHNPSDEDRFIPACSSMQRNKKGPARESGAF
jgi:hypothetical protein